MSEVFAEVVQLDDVSLHAHADRLEVATIRGATTVITKGSFAKGDIAVYFPPDLLIPVDVAEKLGVANYLKHAEYPGDVGKSQCRVAAARLRSIPSYGFLIPLSAMGEVFTCHRTDPDAQASRREFQVGDDVSSYFRAVKYEPPIKVGIGEAAPEFPQFHRYTDIQSFLRYPDRIPEGTMCRFTEKIHGSNCRVGLVRLDDGTFQFMAGSNKIVRRRPDEGRQCKYWEPLESHGLLELLTNLCNEKHSVVVFGEIYGPGIQDLDYGVPAGQRGFRVFDITIDGQYVDLPFLTRTLNTHGVEMVPLLATQPFSKELIRQLTDGPTTLGKPTSKFKGREGVVATPILEQVTRVGGARMIVKSVSADYLDRKGAEDNE